MSSDTPKDPFSIPNQVNKCLGFFRSVHGSLASAEPIVCTKLPASVTHDLLGRFRLWVGNIGAHRNGRASLAYKLREASHIRIRVSELLQHLENDLQDTLQIVTGQRVSWEDITYSDSDSDTSETGSHFSEEHLPTELAQLASNISEVIVCLMRLSIAIRNPAPHDRFRHSTETANDTLSQQWDIAHVREKFPDAPEYLILRLGKAISRRRQYLQYQEEHREDLERGIDPDTIPQELGVSQEAGPLATVAESALASSLPSAVKVGVIAPDFSLLDDNDETASQTTYASSNNDSSAIRPPRLPEQGLDGELFECPLCCRLMSVQHARAWKKHVYTDLQPYICTAPDCQVPDHTYESRHEWFQHELQAHRKWWECIVGCNKAFQTPDELREHIRYEHTELANNSRVDDVVRSCERQYSMNQEACCPLCTETQRSLTQLRRHLGTHHEQLSLFAILPHMYGDEEGSDDDEEVDEPSIASSAESSDAEKLEVEDPVDDESDTNAKEGVDELREFHLHKYGSLSVADFHGLAASIPTDVPTSRPTAQPLQSLSSTISSGEPIDPARIPDSYTLTTVESRYVRKEKLIELLEKLFGEDQIVQFDSRKLVWRYWTPRPLSEEEVA